MTRARGFTLVEVMVALLIFGMLAAAGVAILAQSVRAQGAIDRALDATGGIARVSAALTADLAQAADRPTRDAAGVRRPAFAGDAAGAAFVRGGRTAYDEAPRSSLQKVAWRLDGTALVREGYPMLDGTAPPPAATMMTDLAGARWRYRVAGAWADRFEGAPGVPLPQAVELTLVPRAGAPVRLLFYVGIVGAEAPGGAGDAPRP